MGVKAQRVGARQRKSTTIKVQARKARIRALKIEAISKQCLYVSNIRYIWGPFALIQYHGQKFRAGFHKKVIN